MRLVSTYRCELGMVLAKPVYNHEGSVLLGAYAELTGQAIKRFQQLGIDTVYIRDKATDDLIIEDVVSQQTRKEAIQTLNTVFFEIRKNNTGKKPASSGNLVDKVSKVFRSILSELKSNKNSIQLLNKAHANDNYVLSHSFNTTLYSTVVALKKGYSDKEIFEVGLGALLHDIGHVMIPDKIINKNSCLTNEEFGVIKSHPEYGFNLLRQEYGFPLLAAHCAYQHHERLNGSGYPRGIKKDEIHRHARLLAVADVFEALTSHRTYRRAMLPHLAIEALYSQSGTHFDQEFVEDFRNTIAMYPIGVSVKLNTGELAVVAKNNEVLQSRPIVRVIKNPNGEKLDHYNEVDLSKHLSVMIEECDAVI